MTQKDPTPHEIITLLDAAPGRVAEMAAGLSAARLATPPAPGDWSARDIVAHLLACDDVWGAAIARIAAEDHPTIQAVNPPTWIARTDYLTRPFDALWPAYAAQRAELVALLRGLPAAAWQRAGTRVGAGRPMEYTLGKYALETARHERPHLKQVGRVAAALRAAQT